MHTPRFVFAAVLPFLIMTAAAEENTGVQLAGLRIVGPGSGLNGSELRAFHEPSGTTLVLLVRAPGNGKIVDVDHDRCSLSEFTDDRGSDLLDGIRWGAFPSISEDAGLAMIEVTSKNRPSRDASRISARGTIHLRCADSEKTVKIEKLRLDIGAKAGVGKQVIQVMKAQQDEDGLTLVLQIGRKFVDDMKDIRFFTTGGSPVEIGGRGSFTFGNVSQMEYQLDAREKPEALKLEMDLWQGLEVLDLPFSIESGLGI